MAIQRAVDKFMHELGDIYDAEHRLLEGQRLMSREASDPTLKKLIDTHIAETQTHIQNLEKVFQLMGAGPSRQECMGAEGLVGEGAKMMSETQAPLRDSVIGGAATKVEHYEIVSYTDLIGGVSALGHKQAATLLERNLKQEQKTAQRLEKEAPRLLKLAMKATGEAPPTTRSAGPTSARRNGGRTSR